MLAVLLSLACFLPLPGTVEMGEECSSSTECVDDGTCLKGVCSGYSCHDDNDCGEEQECGSIAGVLTCATPCQSDSDCPGEMSCEPWDDGDYCI